MRLYLAVAVLLLALVAYTEAQDETFEQKVNKLGEQVVQGAKTLAERAENAFQNVHESEFATRFRGFFTRLGEKFTSATTDSSK